MGLPPSQSSGGSIGGQQNCLLSEFPMSLYYSHGVALLGAFRPANAKLLALAISVFTVLLSAYFIARITINKKAPVFRLGPFYLLGAWRCTTLAWQLPHYHRRSCVSLLSSEWIQVVPQRYCHQAKTVFMSLTSKLDRILYHTITNTLGVVWLSLSGN